MITVSLCVIVKDEADVLERMLKSAAPVADEIIIVDTGSTDRTKEIAASYTSRIYDFPWIEDFSAARNFACSKAEMDYWMWLDADDVITPEAQKELTDLKNTLDPSTDIVMMKYTGGFDQTDSPSLSYYRERLIRNKKGFLWQGRVHEAIVLSGNIIWKPIEIQHRKISPGDPDRNLRIYRSMLRRGEKLEPRHQYYFGRELLDHGNDAEAARILEHFLEEPLGWSENKIDACLLLSRIYEKTGRKKEAFLSLFRSFLYDTPRAEICCGIGRLKLEEKHYRQAISWYQLALRDHPEFHPSAFTRTDYCGYIPYVQLCICYNALGDRKTAYSCHQKARKIKPLAEAVRYNEAYFEQFPELHQTCSTDI